MSPPSFPQEKVHFDSIGHHFGKLGEEGKIGHRVIDLTRPEDLDGKASSSSCFQLYLSSVLSVEGFVGKTKSTRGCEGASAD